MIEPEITPTRSKPSPPVAEPWVDRLELLPNVVSNGGDRISETELGGLTFNADFDSGNVVRVCQRSDAEAAARWSAASGSERAGYDATMDPGLARLMAAVSTPGRGQDDGQATVDAAALIDPALALASPVYVAALCGASVTITTNSHLRWRILRAGAPKPQQDRLSELLQRVEEPMKQFESNHDKAIRKNKESAMRQARARRSARNRF